LYDSFLHNCLFFTANRLSRAITKIAEEEFAATGLTPMYGYLILLVNGQPGVSQKELAEKLAIAPSTVTRFIDKLEAKRLVERKVQGKTVHVNPTPKGQELEAAIRQASKRLKISYSNLLGTEEGHRLTVDTELAGQKLEKG
jgi:Transcriptional regulators